MTSDRWITYNGFSGAPGGERPLPDTGLRLERSERPQPAPHQFEPDEYRLPSRPRGARPGVSRNMLLGGVAAAVGLGLLFGVVAKPDLGSGVARAPMQPVTPAARTSTAVPIEVAPTAPTAVQATPAGKLEVLPPDLARRPAATGAATDVAARTAAPRPVIVPPPPVRGEIAPAPPQIAVAPPAAERRPQPSFNCRYASSRSERMVCGDAELARLDRRLDQAFDRAVASGIPYRELRAEQDDWLAVREDAARRSPDAVESIYRQRIAELEDLAG
jgi:uncharacterized protein YecT (DUF1311 family)